MQEKTSEEKTSEEKKEWLQQYGNIDRKIKSLLEQKMEIVAEMTSVRALVYDDMPHAGKKSDLADCLIRFDKICNIIDRKRVALLRVKIAIETAVFNLGDAKESEVIRKRYLNLKSWDTIAIDMGYEVRQIHRIHGYALAHLKMS